MDVFNINMFWTLLVAITLFSVPVDSMSIERVCKSNPADVVFVLDESGSISGPHFEKQLQFVTDVIDVFNINHNSVRIGVMTFGDFARVQFNLGEVSTYDALDSVIGQIRQLRGDTQTGPALQRMHTEMFSQTYARPGVPHIAIVITDGESEDPVLTAEEAHSAHATGITVFAVGVGMKVRYDELYAIASSPDYVFGVDTYEALDTLRTMLASQACKVKVTTANTTASTTTTTKERPPPQNTRLCRAADVIFAIPDEAGIRDTNLTLTFIQNVLPDADEVGPLGIRIGLTPRLCSAKRGKPPIHLGSHDTKRGFVRAIDRRYLESTRLSVQLEQIIIGMDDGRGDVPNSQPGRGKLGILIVDNVAEDPGLMEKLSSKIKDRDIELVTIGVGEYVDTDELSLMASGVHAWHHVNSYDELEELEHKIQGDICRPRSSLTI